MVCAGFPSIVYFYFLLFLNRSEIQFNSKSLLIMLVRVSIVGILVGHGCNNPAAAPEQKKKLGHINTIRTLPI